MVMFTLTCIGEDRPGLVSDLSAVIGAHDGSWERSQMTRLAGKFAGVLLVQVPGANADALVAGLAALADAGLQVNAERAAAPARPETVRMQLDLLGADRPGIVAEVSAALAQRRVTVENLVTDVYEAPMAGDLLFEAQAVLGAPPQLSIEGLRAVLEELADELMVEVRLSEPDVEDAVHPAG